MTRKLVMACMAVAAFAALALPAAASASPVLTENGVAVATGKKIVGTQVGTSTFTSTDGTRKQLVCSTGTLTGELTANTGSLIEGKVTSMLFGGTGGTNPNEPQEPECTGESGFGNATVTGVVSTKAPWCLKTIGSDQWTLAGCATEKIKWLMVTTLAGTCEYESTAHLVGTHSTGGTDGTMTATGETHNGTGGNTNGFSKIAGSFLCPSSGTVDMTFTLETDETTTHLVIS
jgi:hypothetical protein